MTLTKMHLLDVKDLVLEPGEGAPLLDVLGLVLDLGEDAP